MAEYELVCEIFNQCSGNQMRDVDFQEISVEDTDAYMASIEPRAVITRTDMPGGVILYDTDIAGLRKRYSFTPL